MYPPRRDSSFPLTGRNPRGAAQGLTAPRGRNDRTNRKGPHGASRRSTWAVVRITFSRSGKDV
jgi:hypothetical protein